jgi:hypothetical protein
MNPELQHLKEAFSECLLNDYISPTDIYEALMSAIEEDEKYFQSQIDRIKRVRNLMGSTQYSYDFYDKLSNTNRL